MILTKQVEKYSFLSAQLPLVEKLHKFTLGQTGYNAQVLEWRNCMAEVAAA